MNCLDHAPSPVPAVAVCTHCGAAVCGEHAVVAPDRLHRMELINRPVPVDPPARIIRCQTCSAANAAVKDRTRRR